MMKRFNSPVALVLVTGLIAINLPAHEVLQGPTELRFWDKAKAFYGYTLFAAHGRTYLIDMQGRVVQTWRQGTNPRFLANGNLLDATRDDPSGFLGFREVDWRGKVIWQHQETHQGYYPHHDFVRIFNRKLKAPTTLYIANRTVTREQAIAAGADPKKLRSRAGGRAGGRGGGGRRKGGGAIQVDAVVEIDMAGRVVWEWWFFDHLVQDRFPDKANYAGRGKGIADHPGRLNVNLPGRPLNRDWLHCNSLDYNAELDQIVINSVQGEFYVIDHGATFVPGDPQKSISLAAGPKGDFLYRFGDPARYGRGDPPAILEDWTSSTSGHKQIGGSHDVQWIKPGLPGAGHFLVFNNGQYLFRRTNQSSILEIDGYLARDGRRDGGYVDPPGAGYTVVRAGHDTHKPPYNRSRQVVWSYASKSNQGFFSHIGSGCQRLPNGNTLICSDTEGHLFEVTAQGDLAWEYINPLTRAGAVKVLRDSLPMTNSVFRCYRYGPDHPALRGRELTPQGTLVARATQGLDRREGGRDRTSGRARQAMEDRPATEPGDRGGRRGGRDRERGAGRRQQGSDPLLRLLDTNGDRRLSRAEIDQVTRKLLRMDRDGDGQVSREELREARRGGRRGEGDGGRKETRRNPGEKGGNRGNTPAAPGELIKIADGFRFTEGPAADREGNIYFTDVHANRIHRWTIDGRLSVFRENTGGTNGLYFDRSGNLLACEGERGRLVSIDAKGNTTSLISTYQGRRFNKPNDLWIDPQGGIYFTDPVYGRTVKSQDGEHVYYLLPDRSKVIRVIDDMVRPNGIVGTGDGRILYVTDHGAGRTYRYTIKADGTLADKRLFVSVGSDGMTLDREGNLYLTAKAVHVYRSDGLHLRSIPVPTPPTNVCFGGRGGRTLFITARTAVYALPPGDRRSGQGGRRKGEGR